MHTERRPESTGTLWIRPRFFSSVLGIAWLLAAAGCSREAPVSASPLAWAYVTAAPAPEPVVAPGTYRIPDSKRSFTADELNGDDAVDWIPDDHPVAPPVIWHYRPHGPIPCAACHYFNGKGFLHMPDLAGLPRSYIVQQVIEFRSGRRKSYHKGRVGTDRMIGVATRLTDAELAQAADYFSHLPRRPWFRVVETDTVPATKPDYYGWFDLVKNGGTEPIKGRIIELPEDWDRTWIEDPHSGVVAYVPPGSVSRGEALVRMAGNSAVACATCHGPDLRGMGETPSIAGRSPAYVARMLWDIKSGARSGPAVALMQPVVAQLSGSDITDLAAYLVSLKP